MLAPWQLTFFALMMLSIIIPCFNEKDLLPQVIPLVKESPVAEKEIILVDDGSSDGTTELIKAQIEKEVDKVIYHPVNMGKGAAIRSGLSAVSGDIVLIQDADLEKTQRKYLMVPVFSVAGNLTKAMAAKVDTQQGRRIYPQRLAVVEPVFANIEIHKGMNQFTLRSKIKVSIQWMLYCMIHNIGKILHCVVKYVCTY